jgi:hypothetical protein
MVESQLGLFLSRPRSLGRETLREVDNRCGPRARRIRTGRASAKITPSPPQKICKPTVTSGQPGLKVSSNAITLCAAFSAWLLLAEQNDDLRMSTWIGPTVPGCAKTAFRHTGNSLEYVQFE